MLGRLHSATLFVLAAAQTLQLNNSKPYLSREACHWLKPLNGSWLLVCHSWPVNTLPTPSKAGSVAWAVKAPAGSARENPGHVSPIRQEPWQGQLKVIKEVLGKFSALHRQCYMPYML
eukprot:1161204-Pelagomonas_calceolata.AAC.3